MPDSYPDRPPQGQAVSKSTAVPLPRPLRISVLLFCTTTFLFWAALYLYFPVLPVYAQSMGASLSMVGAVISSYAIAQLLLRIPIGVVADALGRRKPLVAGGIVAASVGALGLGLAPNPWFLFLGRAFAGVGAATWVAFAVFFVSYYPRDRTARAIGIISFVNGVALVAATSAGGVIAQVWGFGPTFFVAGLLGIVALVALLPTREPVKYRAQAVSWRGLLRVATHPLLLTVSFMSILLHFVQHASVFSFIPVYAVEIGASRADLGVITMLALSSAALAALGTVYMVERWGYHVTILLGSVLLGTALLSVPFVQRVYLLEVVQLVNGMSRGLLQTAFMALSISAVAPEQRAMAMGVYQALYAVGTLLGPLVSGFLADSLGLASVFYMCALLSLVMGGMAYLRIIPRR